MSEPSYIVLDHGERGIMTPTVFLEEANLHMICRELNRLLDRLNRAETLIEAWRIGRAQSKEAVLQMDECADELEQALAVKEGPHE